MPVALDVAVLAADDEQDGLFVAGVRDAALRRRLRVEEPAFAELLRLAVDVDLHAALVHEVELILRVVVVQETLVAGRQDECVDAEGRDAERLADLPKAGPFAELVD